MRELDPARDRYLILATDGLWERLTNEEVAKVVCSFKEQPSRHHQVGQGPRLHYDPPSSGLYRAAMTPSRLLKPCFLPSICRPSR